MDLLRVLLLCFFSIPVYGQVPLLEYNCAKMPAICRNVNQRNPLQNVPGVAGAGNLGALDTGHTPGGLSYITLNYDTNPANKRRRRTAACPNSWPATHHCPEPNQPPVVQARTGGRQGDLWGMGSWQGVRWNPNNLPPGSAAYNLIANAAGTASSGLFWSCDEWPPATTIEGGAAAFTYCAPLAASCFDNSGPQANGEQDIQGNIHDVLRNRLNYPGRTQPNTVYPFHFRTRWDDSEGAPGAAVYTGPDNNFLEVTAYKRSLEQFMMAVDEVYPNKTVVSYQRRMTSAEVDVHIEAMLRKRDSTNLTMSAMSDIGVMPATSSNNASGPSPAKQVFENLPVAPPLPIVDITRTFIERLAGIQEVPYLNQVLGFFTSIVPPLPPLPIFDTHKSLTTGSVKGSSTAGAGLSTSSQDAQSSTTIVSTDASTQSNASQATSASGSNLGSQASALLGRHASPHSAFDLKKSESWPNSLFSRAEAVSQCGPNSPCPDGSCCNNNGGCGYGPENCGKGNCTNNCDATALCGRDSAGGKVKCPLNVCCSYYGYCGTDAEYCSSPNPDAPCQKGFGTCGTVPAPSCGGNSATQRSIAYYQVANTYTRQCQRISPSQINTTGLTHLNLAFAGIDPSSFHVVPGDDRDVPIYKEFTALKTSTLQTWIAVGGWDFNDPGPNRNTFHNIAASSANRATFISSLKSFMDQYGFQGVDLDWEYPGAPDRDGQPEDTANLVQLLKEMRSSFGTSYGISATLPSSYWYLRWFNPIAMQQYVDFFGLMTYDLHGPWDAGIRQIGPTIIGQTNVPEIANWTLPLWYDKVDPSKVNLGLAYYGRGYTVEDVSCTHVGCKWSGPSRAGPCTSFSGVMSLQEIQQLIPQIGTKPILDSEAMMKYLVWSNQWLGYDDLETIAMKKNWASSHCFGGTMIWSIDLFSGAGSGNTPDGGGSTSPSDPGAGGGQGGGGEGTSDGVVYIDPSIWNQSNPEIQCQPPCTFVLPPRQLSTTTTITFPPYVTSLDVAWSASTGWTHIIETTTLKIPPVKTTAIPAWEYIVTDTRTASTVISSFYPTSSILPPPFKITNDRNPLKQSGVTHPPATRTITPPPFPYSFTTNSEKSSSSTSSTTAAAAIFPWVTYKPGPPGPICKTGCGTECHIFCDHPCLINCPDGGNDFIDPHDPDPPPRPTPTAENHPIPSGDISTTAPLDPPDPHETDPQNEEEEDEDYECAIEFHLPIPTYVDPNAGAVGTQTISSAQPPPTPQPPANPAPPSPNPSTEKLHCYNSGAMTGRGSMIDAVTDFCNLYTGRILDASDPKTENRISYSDHNAGVCFGELGCTEVLELSITVINGCRFTVDGPGANEECGRIFREAIDRCDMSSTKYKQGGYVSSNCANYNIDPNNYW